MCSMMRDYASQMLGYFQFIIPFGIVSLLHLLGMFRRMIFKREGNSLIFTRVWLEKKERFICAFVRSLKRLNILYYNFQKISQFWDKDCKGYGWYFKSINNWNRICVLNINKVWLKYIYVYFINKNSDLFNDIHLFFIFFWNISSMQLNANINQTHKKETTIGSHLLSKHQYKRQILKFSQIDSLRKQ